MMSVAEAQAQILAQVPRLGTESVDLLSALGRVLAKPVVARDDLPPFDNTSMDGYAVIAADTQAAPVTLHVVGTVPAGRMAPFRIERGQTAKIMTGAPLPPGADAVVQVEWTRPAEAGRVVIERPVEPGHNLRHRGEDVRAGQVVLDAGERITPGVVGILAAVGATAVEVWRRPRVAILATGDELVAIDQPLRPGTIRNSNSYALAAAVEAAGGDPILLPPAPDELGAIEAALVRALDVEQADVVISSGGVSVGDFDLVKAALERHGELDFWRVHMKPGKPMVFGHLGRRPFLGLPGNPVSALVTFELFVRPLLREMQGDRDWQRPVVALPLAEPFSEVSDRPHYVRVRIAPNGAGELSAWPNPAQGSNIQTSWHRARGLMVVPENSGPWAPGDRLPVILLD
ncbi:MAG: molybdopterin molybdotransferase MoeA [Firmicutes bacterium]|nr:molybdopterin molybdotransferase MoeA [Alicyclobacillaceae bacterium]MCL6497156.1 molybdopterin molybdotransferase MoeA [Bacillota bacterium]